MSESTSQRKLRFPDDYLVDEIQYDQRRQQFLDTCSLHGANSAMGLQNSADSAAEDFR